MKIHLISYTSNPERSIAAPMMNMGIGKDITDLNQISDDEVKEYVGEILKSNLPEPLTFASFNFFWQDIPLFLRAQLVRHHIGWSFAERSMRFYDANMDDPINSVDWNGLPTIKDKMGTGKSSDYNPLSGANLQEVVDKEMKRQLELYKLLIKAGADQQDARNIVGVWYPTNIQTTCTFYALRHMISKRIGSQAHPLWQEAAKQIKALVMQVSPVLGESLVDACSIAGRCVWKSKLDRDCADCIARGTEKAHEHKWTRDTTFGEKTQCDCGSLKPMNLIKAKNK